MRDLQLSLAMALLLILIFAVPAMVQKGMGEPTGVARQAVKPLIETMSGTRFGAPAIADEVADYYANLSGAGEVPAVNTAAHGEVLFWVSEDQQSVRYRLSVADMQDLTFAHLHLGRAGAPGPVVAWLYPERPPKLISGMFTGIVAERSLEPHDLVGPLQGQSVRDLVSELKAGNTYVNVHSNRYSAGEIGSQVE